MFTELAVAQLKSRRINQRAGPENCFTNRIPEKKLLKLKEAPVSQTTLLDNKKGESLVYQLLATMVVYIFAIFWNMFALWSPKEPDIWNDNWQTAMSKSIITITCIVMAVHVVLIRSLDLKMIPPGLQRQMHWSCIVLETSFILMHVPPVTMGFFKRKDDLWNILGTAKLYLLLELLKISHPLWLKRYYIAEARAASSLPPRYIGPCFCFCALKIDPVTFFVELLILALLMFTLWWFFMERDIEGFNFPDAIDTVLSAFFSVPPGQFSSPDTFTAKKIKLLIGLFSMLYAAVVGWSFGFGVAEKSQTTADMLDDVDRWILFQHRSAKKIQTWWKELKRKDFIDNVPEFWAGAFKKEKRKSNTRTAITMSDLLAEMEKIWSTMSQLKKSNEQMAKANGDFKDTLLLFIKKRRGRKGRKKTKKPSHIMDKAGKDFTRAPTSKKLDALVANYADLLIN